MDVRTQMRSAVGPSVPSLGHLEIFRLHPIERRAPMEKNRGAPAEERTLRGYPVTRINLAERRARMQHRDNRVVFFEVPYRASVRGCRVVKESYGISLRIFAKDTSNNMTLQETWEVNSLDGKSRQECFVWVHLRF